MLEAEPLQQAVRQRLAGTRVLLAEDHPLNQQLACELLRRAGVEVVVAKDGQEALDMLARRGAVRRRADGLPDAGDGRLHRDPRAAQEPGRGSACR